MVKSEPTLCPTAKLADDFLKHGVVERISPTPKRSDPYRFEGSGDAVTQITVLQGAIRDL